MLTFHLDIIYVNLLQWSCQLTYTSLLPQMISSFWKYCVPYLSVRFLGNGLVTAQNHAQWYKQRRIMDPAFSSLWVIKSSQGDRTEYLLNLLFLYPVLVVKWNPVQIMVLFSALILLDNIVYWQHFCGALKVCFGHACLLTENCPYLQVFERTRWGQQCQSAHWAGVITDIISKLRSHHPLTAQHWTAMAQHHQVSTSHKMNRKLTLDNSLKKWGYNLPAKSQDTELVLRLKAALSSLTHSLFLL